MPQPGATAEVLIIGGGIIGSAIACAVARQGRSVLVVERQPRAARPVASWASAGGIRPQGLHPAEAALARIALSRWPHLADELDADLHFRPSGHVLLAESDAEADHLQRMVQQQRDHKGMDLSFVDRQTLRELVPGLSDHIVAGSVSAASGHADPRRTTHAFATAAQRRGAIFWTGTACLTLHRVADRVVGAQTGRGSIQAEHVVLAAGAWSRELARSIGIALPLRVRALQALLSTPAPPDTLRPVLSTVRGTLSLKQQPDGALLLGGGWLADVTEDGRSYVLRKASQQGNWSLACEVFPLVRTLRLARAWAGLQAQSLDDLPLIGSIPGLAGLTLALGSWYGFALAPAIGPAVATHLAGLPTPELDQLSPARFTHLTPAQLAAFQAEPASATALEDIHPPEP